MSRICVVGGGGYVGLGYAVAPAELGHDLVQDARTERAARPNGSLTAKDERVPDRLCCRPCVATDTAPRAPRLPALRRPCPTGPMVIRGQAGAEILCPRDATSPYVRRDLGARVAGGCG